MSLAADSLALRVQAEQIAAEHDSTVRIGAPSLLADSDTVQLLLAAIRDGNYRETACRSAGIPKQTFYNWLKRAERGDLAAIAFVDALEKAEADAEIDTVRNVRSASKLPQFWAAGMTWLERKSPDRWGRRSDDSGAPRVVVQIGVSSNEVQIATFAPNPSVDSLCKPTLSGDPVSDNARYVALSEPVSQVLTTQAGASAADPAGGPSPGEGGATLADKLPTKGAKRSTLNASGMYEGRGARGYRGGRKKKRRLTGESGRNRIRDYGKAGKRENAHIAGERGDVAGGETSSGGGRGDGAASDGTGVDGVVGAEGGISRGGEPGD